jgi:nicotinate dehydrogenase subunit A
LEINVNGGARHCDAPAGSMAVYVLRNDLGLAGVRLGCGEGHCGACTVLVDGRPATTCDMPLAALEGRQVTTPEGVGAGGLLHPVQAALLEHQAGQCGFCLSGILMTAVALVDGERAPSEQEVRAALDRHLCRCGSQHRILQAVLAAVRKVHPA